MGRQVMINGNMVKERHPFAPLGLSIITFGIYGLVWWYKINREMRDLGEQVSPGMATLALSPLGWLLILPPFVTVWMTTERIRRVQHLAKLPKGVSPIASLFLAVIPILSFFWQAYLQGGLNEAYDRMFRNELRAGPNGAWAPPSDRRQEPVPQQPATPAPVAPVYQPPVQVVMAQPTPPQAVAPVAATPAAATCPSCAAAIRPGTRFCENCGHRLVT